MSPKLKHVVDLMKYLLEREMIQIFIDTNRGLTILPEYLKNERFISLNLSYRFERDADIEFNDDSLQATLTFKGQPFRVSIPYQSIFKIVTRSGESYNLDTSLHSLVDSYLKESKNSYPKFTLIPGGGELTPPRKGHLRLVN